MSENERKAIEDARYSDTDRIFTLPNLLSFFRLLLIPVIVWLYDGGHYWWAFGTLILSGATDVIDGWIARTFHLVSDFGKAIDPIADKLTQAAMLLCLMREHLWLIGVLALKEISIGILSLIARHATGKVYSAGWYGKLCTVIIYLSMGLLLIWKAPAAFVLCDALLIAGLILLSFTMYFIRFTAIIREARGGNAHEAS